jgi:hypothetical protein
MKTLLLAIILLVSTPCFAERMSVEQIMSSSCRISVQHCEKANCGRSHWGSGGTIEEDDSNYYVLTVGHIFYGNLNKFYDGPIYVEYFYAGKSVGKVLANLVFIEFDDKDGSCIDLAMLSVAKSQMQNTPSVIRLENPKFNIPVGTEVFSSSSPHASNTRYFKANIIQSDAYKYVVNTRYIDGDSGSLLMGHFFNDGDKTEEHTSVIGVNYGRGKNNAPTGHALSLQRVFQLLTQNHVAQANTVGYDLVQYPGQEMWQFQQPQQTCGPNGCPPLLQPLKSLRPNPKKPTIVGPVPKIDYFGKQKSDTVEQGAPEIKPIISDNPDVAAPLPPVPTTTSNPSKWKDRIKQLESELLASESSKQPLVKDVERQRGQIETLQTQLNELLDVSKINSNLNVEIAEKEKELFATTTQVEEYKTSFDDMKTKLLAQDELVLEAGKHPLDNATNGFGVAIDRGISGLLGAGILAGSVALLGPAAGPVARFLTPMATKIVTKAGKKVVGGVIGRVKDRFDGDDEPNIKGGWNPPATTAPPPAPVTPPMPIPQQELDALVDIQQKKSDKITEKPEKVVPNLPSQDYNTTDSNPVETSYDEPSVPHSPNKAVPTNVLQLFELKGKTEDIRKYAVFAFLYIEAVDRLRNGLLHYKPGVKLQGQETIANAVDLYVHKELMSRVTIEDVTVDNKFYFNALKGFLYQEAVNKLRQGAFGVLGAENAANAIDQYVEKEFLRRMNIL